MNKNPAHDSIHKSGERHIFLKDGTKVLCSAAGYRAVRPNGFEEKARAAASKTAPVENH